MNLNKLTKAELISKLKDTKKESTKSSPTNYYNLFTSYLWEILNLFNLIKELLFKLTFITFIYKILSKYKIVRKLLHYIYKVLIGVFGFTFIEHLGFLETLSSFWNQVSLYYLMIIDYLKGVYKILIEHIFGKEDDDEIPEPFDPLTIIESDQSIKPDDNPKSVGYTKYVIYTLMIATVGAVVIIYHEEIYESGLALWDKIVNSFRPGEPDGNSGIDPNGNNPTNNAGGDRPDIQTIIIEGSQPSSPSSISSEDTIKPVYSSATSNIGESSGSSVLDSNVSKINKVNSIIDQNKVLFHEKFASVDYWSDNWKNWIQKDLKENIQTINNLVTSNELCKKSSQEVIERFIDVIVEYNKDIDLLNSGKLNTDSHDKLIKVLGYLRKWISETNFLINDNKGIVEDALTKIEFDDLFKK